MLTNKKRRNMSTLCCPCNNEIKNTTQTTTM